MNRSLNFIKEYNICIEIIKYFLDWLLNIFIILYLSFILFNLRFNSIRFYLFSNMSWCKFYYCSRLTWSKIANSISNHESSRGIWDTLLLLYPGKRFIVRKVYGDHKAQLLLRISIKYLIPVILLEGDELIA